MKSHKEKIDRIINLKRENNLWNHILTSLFHRGKTIAERNGEKYIIWTSNLWTGGFYPIFKIAFNEKNEISKIETELSLYGKLCFVIIALIVLTFTSFIIIIPIIENITEVNIYFLIPLILYSLLIFGFYLVFKNIYLREKRYLTEDLKVIVGVETRENIEKIENEKNEWTMKMTLFRLFAYPFSIFIVLISIYALYTGTYLRSGLGIILGVGYLYSDIRTIQKKRKITKANNV